MLAVGPDELLSRLVRYLEDMMQVRGGHKALPAGRIILFTDGLPRGLGDTHRHSEAGAHVHDNMRR